MSVKIRLQRHGSTHRPFYHLVATDKRNSRDGRFIEKLGYYDPNKEPSIVSQKQERIQHWYGKGAELSPHVATILKKQKIAVTRNQTHTPKK